MTRQTRPTRPTRPTIPQLLAVLELLARFHPARLGVLLGQVCPPDTEEIAELLSIFHTASDLGARISGGGNRLPEAERLLVLTETFICIVEAVGGWEHITATANQVKVEVTAAWWQSAHDYVTYITPGGHVRDGEGGMGERLFSPMGAHKTCIRTARRRFRQLMRVIAIKILSTKPDGSYELILSADAGGGYPS